MGSEPKSTDHDWREMDRKEAYPATSGRACRRCGVVELGWLGHPIDQTQELVRAFGGQLKATPSCTGRLINEQ